jgi:hypothetical protein
MLRSVSPTNLEGAAMTITLVATVGQKGVMCVAGYELAR